MPAAWEERFPGRLEYELDDFRRRGLDDFIVVERERNRVGGRIVLEGTIAHGDTTVELRVVYPDSFPYFRPEVYAPHLHLGRHQNPYEGNLCLLEASTGEWRTNETGAWLVAERVPHLLDIVAKGGAEMRAAEVPQGEPDSSYIPREPGSAVFIPEEALELNEEATHGALYLSWNPERLGPPVVHALLRQVNVAAKSGAGKPAAVAAPSLKRRFSGPSVEGRWVRVKALPGRDPEAYFSAAEAVWHGSGSPPWQAVGDAEVAIVGVVFPEEIQQGTWRDSWMFAVRWRTRRNAHQAGAYLTRGERYGSDDMLARIPRLRGIESKKVALTGLGSLGAPLAFELARCQLGELDALDHDGVEAGNTVRWPVGLPAVGWPKTRIVEGVIGGQWPRTALTCRQRRLGTAAPIWEAGPGDFQVLEEMMEGSDLVVDTTGEIAIQQLVGDLAQERGLGQVYVWGTEGAYGGAVARIVPGATGCWYCLQLAIDDDSIPPPPYEPGGRVQPPGCASLTFTGESFNQLPVIAQAARVISGTLLGTLVPGSDVFMLSLRDGEEAAVAPMWTTHTLRPHRDCIVCHCTPGA